MKKYSLFHKITATAVALVLLLGMVPSFTLHSSAQNATADVIADPGTSSAWEHIMGSDSDGTRYAGRVWADKSVYTHGQTALLDSAGKANSSFTASLDTANGEYFQVIFSALGSSLSTNTTVTAVRPLDVVIVLDSSTSMAFDADDGQPRLTHMITAANQLLEDLTALTDIRIALVTYNEDSETVLELDTYSNGIVLSTNHPTNTDYGGVITARDEDGRYLGADDGYHRGTNLQSGIDRGMNLLATASNPEGRTPVAIVLTDGEANHAVMDSWYDLSEGELYGGFSLSAGVAMSTLLNAAYGKSKAEAHYGSDVTVYGIGVDLETGSAAHALMNPGDANVGFNANNDHEEITDAYTAFRRWRQGNTVTISAGRWETWTFDHNLPAGSVTSMDVAANINYVDNYQDVSSANLEDAFDNIYQELATGAFNPITSTQQGSTGVQDTPLIFVDNIGAYMQIRQIQAVRVFDTTYYVTKNADGSYFIDAGEGVNPTTGENWSTDDIRINIFENADGTQQLRIYINQEILPILLDKVTVNTENGVTTTTLEQVAYPPLRIFYTVGIDPEILMADGTVDPTKIADDYAHRNADGTVSLFSNGFGQLCPDDANGNGLFDKGDAHVGFVPSHNNRYYYHQLHHDVYISATNLDGSDIEWDDGSYGTVLEEGKFALEPMSYADYASLSDNDSIYSVITFVRPTADPTDGNAAEQIDYLIHTTWGYLKKAITFLDTVNGTYLNEGVAMDPTTTAATVEAYMTANALSATQMVAKLGLEGQRVTRLNSMFEDKADNATGTAELSYAPTYSDSSHDEDDVHEHSKVIMWLGNNGKLTLPMATGLQVTKTVAELADGSSADEKFEIRALLDLAYTAQAAQAITVTDDSGAALAAGDYSISNEQGKLMVTVHLADGESAIIWGVPGETDYTVTEAEHSKYTYSYTGDNRTVTGAVSSGTVTNDSIKPGALYITKEVAHSIEGEVFPTTYEFEFKVTFLDAQGNPIANTTFPMENNYEPNRVQQDTDDEGVMYGKLRHGETVYIKNIPAGATVIVQEINIPDSYGQNPVYRSRDHSGATADADGIVTISSQQNATVVVTNTYTPKSTSLDLTISGQKDFQVNGTLDAQHAGSFTFLVEKWNGTSWDALPGKSAKLEYAAGSGSSVRPFTIELEDLVFDRAGVYAYQVREQIGTIPNVTYDRTLYTFTVTVEDVNGQLVASVTDLNNQPITNGIYNVSFENSFNSAPVSVNILKTFDDRSGNPLTSPAGFAFIAQEAQVDGNGVWSVVPGGSSERVFSDGAGEARFSAIYKAEGTYRFLISEEDSGLPGWDYTQKVYQVEVVVTKDATTGELTANLIIDGVSQNSDNADLNFHNIYKPTEASVEADTLVNKELTGRTPVAGEFNFAIFKDGTASFTDTANALFLGTNDAQGKVSFTATDYGVAQGFAVEGGNKLIFTKVGDYFFDIVELTGDLGGVTYDRIIYDLVVEITDNGDGTLKQNFYFEDSPNKQVTFRNTYTATPTRVVIEGIKHLHVLRGEKHLAAGEFTFGLFDAENNLLTTTQNYADGHFRFRALRYTLADAGRSYTYTVREIVPTGATQNPDGSYSLNGVTYSTQSFTVTVTVTDNRDGTLSAVTTGNGAANIRFVNEYRSNPVPVTLSATKNLYGRELTAGEFTFALYNANAAFEKGALISNTITHDAQGAFTLQLGELGMGKHYFIVEEVIPTQHAPGIYYYAGAYHITVTVTDNGQGQMSYTTTVVNPGNPDDTDAPIIFNNLYRPADNELLLEGTKEYLGGKELTDGIFSIGLYDDQGTLLQTAPIGADGRFVFNVLRFSADDLGKTFTYTVKEIIPEGATEMPDGRFKLGSDIYDPTVYTVTVTVTDDDAADGRLELDYAVTLNGSAAQLHFVNTFIPNPVSHPLTAQKEYNRPLLGNDFAFKLFSADGKTDISQTKRNDADGKIAFDPITFTEAGRYTFYIEETDKLLGFIEYSTAKYLVCIDVVNENGVLKVQTPITVLNAGDNTPAELTFVNKYVVDGGGDVSLQGIKHLIGGRTKVKAGEFSFGLYDAAGTLLEKVSNDEDGKFAFSKLTFTEADLDGAQEKQFTYSVKELAGNDPYITYDDTVYSVAVTVRDDGQGGIDVSYTVNGEAPTADAISFTNRYTPPAPAQLSILIQKQVGNKTDKTLGLDDFTFVLESEDFTGSVVTDADGKASINLFFALSELGKEFTFKVYEKAGNIPGVTYDSKVYTLTVRIEQLADGTLRTLINEEAAASATLKFTNIYAPTTVPDTGDSFPLTTLSALAMSSCIMLAALVLGRKKFYED